MEQAIVAEEMARVNAPRADQRPRHRDRGADDHRPRHRSPEAALPQAHPHRRGHLVPALLRAERRIRPGRPQDQRGKRGRPLRGQRSEDLDQRRSSPMGAAAGPHRSRVPKHKGISCFLMSMRQPGVEVRPLKQITGSAEFAEVFMTQARVRGPISSGGWGRAGRSRRPRSPTSAGRLAGPGDALHIGLPPLVAAARALRRGGRPLLDDPLVRQAGPGLRGAGGAALRGAPRALRARQGRAGPASSITKLSYSEFEKRFNELALEVLGPYGQHRRTCPTRRAPVVASSGHGETWAYSFLWSRAGTIYAG